MHTFLNGGGLNPPNLPSGYATGRGDPVKLSLANFKPKITDCCAITVV